MRVFARAFRRAGLPVRMSQGFNPHPRFSLPWPLPTGIEGLAEVLELDLTADLAPAELARRVSHELPAGLDILDADRLPPGEKARVRSVRYRAAGAVPAGSTERCAARAEIRATRADGRELDVRPYLHRIRPCEGGCEFELLVTETGTARPAEIVAALCEDHPERARQLALTRTAVNLRSPRSPEPPMHPVGR